MFLDNKFSDMEQILCTRLRLKNTLLTENIHLLSSASTPENYAATFRAGRLYICCQHCVEAFLRFRWNLYATH